MFHCADRFLVYPPCTPPSTVSITTSTCYLCGPSICRRLPTETLWNAGQIYKKTIYIAKQITA